MGWPVQKLGAKRGPCRLLALSDRYCGEGKCPLLGEQRIRRHLTWCLGHRSENPLIDGIDLAGGNPDLNDLLIEPPPAPEVCHALS